MNNEIPSLWLWVSGLFFLLGIIFFAATSVVLFKLLKMSEDLKPRVESLTQRVETLMIKIDRVSDHVDEAMVSVKHSVDGVGGKAQGIMGSVESMAKGASSKFEGITPILAGAMALYRLYMTVKAVRAQNQASEAKALPAKKKR